MYGQSVTNNGMIRPLRLSGSECNAACHSASVHPLELSKYDGVITRPTNRLISKPRSICPGMLCPGRISASSNHVISVRFLYASASMSATIWRATPLSDERWERKRSRLSGNVCADISGCCMINSPSQVALDSRDFAPCGVKNSVILLDVGVGAVEQILLVVQFVFEQGPS